MNCIKIRTKLRLDLMHELLQGSGRRMAQDLQRGLSTQRVRCVLMEGKIVKAWCLAAGAVQIPRPYGNDSGIGCRVLP